MSRKEQLPWWRSVRRDGAIALPEGEGAELQRELLKGEGIAFDREGKVAARCFWDGRIDGGWLSGAPDLEM
jgi:alkylated DNA nucleotide flippase Atl1